MDSGLYAAVNGALRTEMKLEVLTNNLANVNTTGFKEENITFDSYMTSPGPEQFPLAGDSFMGLKGPGDIPFPFSNPATNALSVTYPAAPSTTTDTAQGGVVPTANPLDVAINGEGFFVVETPEGRRYTRDGSFEVNKQGELVNKDGYNVLGAGGAKLIIGSSAVNIGEDGTISNATGDLGKLERVGLPAEVLKRVGQNLYSAPRETEIPMDNVAGGVQQGFLEASNSNAIRGMTQMIEANRAFESYMKMIQALDGLDGQANQIGRLS
ncbi:MAG: flagellar basal-body rod protein FlgF [Magnetococcales bacterium]|nr:flagellar basal-body rod protein FlgF [Magnetococcales bacterium]